MTSVSVKGVEVMEGVLFSEVMLFINLAFVLIFFFMTFLLDLVPEEEEELRF